MCIDPVVFVNYVIEIFSTAFELTDTEDNEFQNYQELMGLMPNIFKGISKKFLRDGVKVHADYVMGKLVRF